ncbi:MAG: TetR/AcrR family transcriptional regulator [Acidimicrobiales bacterium]|nr:TetR/AcrR family transcriptional regulator [Acidimicrobiales bacterium]HRW36860.1 TetR/AcrR family transcriptional regulator [Aquihabitans sp.]
MDPGIVRRPPFGTNPSVGERGSDTRRRVLASALELFAEVPYPEARVEQITERAGCSRPAFYQYFSSKEDVFWTLATELGEEMVALADGLGPVGPDEEGLAQLTAWVDDFMALHERWAPVFAAFPEVTRGDRATVSRTGSIADHSARRLVGAFGLPRTAANQRTASSLVGVLIRCSFYAEAAPEGMSRRPLVLGVARLVHRVLGGPVEGVNFKRDRTSGRRRVRIVAPVQPTGADGLRARGEATRRRLLAAGAEVLPRRGYHDVRVDDIVEVAGVSHGTFYRYFQGKDDFFRALGEEASGPLIDLIERLDLDGTDAELRAWLDEWFAAYEAHGGIISTWQDMQTSPELRDFSLQVAASVFTRLEKLLDQRDFGHPQVAASMLLALLERAPYRVHTLGFSKRDAEMDSTALILRRGFLGREG